jgi:hypothetical protein
VEGSFQTGPFSQVHLIIETAVEFSRLDRMLQGIYFQSAALIRFAS